MSPSDRPSSLAPAVQGASGRQQASAWMVTFGDLLTLILCFFIAVISLSRIEKNSRYEQLAKNLEPDARASLAGTGIADSSVKPLVRQVPGRGQVALVLSEEEVAGAGGQTLAQWMESERAARSSTLQLSVCDFSWRDEAPLQEVVGTLAPLGEKGVMLRIAELGVGCDELRSQFAGVEKVDREFQTAKMVFEWVE